MPCPIRVQRVRTSLLAALAAASLGARAVGQAIDTSRYAPYDPAALAADTLKWGQIPARWDFFIGGYIPHVSTTAQLSTRFLAGTSFNLENKLGINPNTQSIDLLAGYRFSKRNVVSLEYFSFARSGSNTLSDSLIVNDTVYKAGATVDANGRIQYFGFTYRYYIWRRQRWELGTGLGIDALNLSLGLGVKVAASGGGGSFTDSARTQGSITAPVPMLGLYFDWEMVPSLYLKGNLQALFLTYQQYSGGVRDRRVAVEWNPWKNYGFGLGWHYVGVDIKKTAPSGGYVKLEYAIQGLSLYATAAFGRPQPVAPRPPIKITEPPAGQDFGLVPRKFSIAIGGYLPSVATKGKLSSPSRSGSDIDLENVLGFPRNVSSLDIEAALRIANRSLITFTYFSFSRDGSKTLTDSLFIGDTVFDPGVTVHAKGGLSYYGFTYRYYFWRPKRFQMGAGIGIDEIDASFGAGIKASLAGKADSLEQKGSLSVPAPMLGVYLDWQPLNRFYVRANGQWIGFNDVAGIGGTVSDDRATVEWYAFKNYGIGAGYHFVGADLHKQLPLDHRIDLKYTIQGVYMYLTAAF